MKSVISEKGQLTVPKALRDSLGLIPGTALDFAEENGALVVRKRAADDPFAALLGILPPMDVDAEIDAMRGPRDDFDGGRHARRGR